MRSNFAAKYFPTLFLDVFDKVDAILDTVDPILVNLE